MQIGDSVKVTKVTGKYKKYMFTIRNGKKYRFVPRREGIIVGFPQEGIGSIAFLNGKTTDSAYYQHVHSYYIENMKITKHNKDSKIDLRLDELREKYNIKEEDMK